MKLRASAFTLIELIIVVTIIAILSLLLALSFSKLRLNARFNNEKTQIVNLIQKARSLSLSNILINDTDPTSYYVLTLEDQDVLIDAYGSDTTIHENLATFNLDSDMRFDTTLEVYYFPPYGDVCFNVSSCTGTTTSEAVVLSEDSGVYSARFTIDINGGYVNVVDL